MEEGHLGHGDNIVRVASNLDDLCPPSPSNMIVDVEAEETFRAVSSIVERIAGQQPPHVTYSPSFSPSRSFKLRKSLLSRVSVVYLRQNYFY